MSTARDLITRAFRISGLIAGAETPDNYEITNGLSELNGIIDILNTDGLWQYTQKTVEFTLDTSKSEYTIGSGGDINDVRPLKIKSLKILSGNTLYPIRQYSMDSWNLRSIGTESAGSPYQFQYIPDYPLGIIDFGANPGTADTVQVTYEYKITEFTLNDTITLPPGYYGTLEYLLATNLCAIYGKQNPQIESIAKKRLLKLKRNNAESAELVLNFGGSHYDYKSDRNI